MRFRTVTALVFFGAVMDSCATPPNNIKATPVSASGYAGKSCAELDAELAKTNSDMAPLLAKQQTTSDNDAVGVLWLGVPIGSMTEKGTKEREAKIAEMKGQMDAIQKARVAGKCAKSTT